MPERFESGWSEQQPEKPRKRGEKLKKPGSRKGVAYGLGAAALGAALAVGTIGEKKPGMPASPATESSGPRRKAVPTPDAKKRFTPPTAAELQTMRQMLTRRPSKESPTMPKAPVGPGDPREEWSDKPLRSDEEQRPLITVLEDKDVRASFLRELAFSNPTDVFRNHLDSLKDLPEVEARTILSNANTGIRDADDEKVLFESLAKVREILSGGDFDSFIEEVVERHPWRYLFELRDGNPEYLPRDAATIVRAVENDPSILVRAGLSAEMNGRDLLAGPIRTAIEEGAGEELAKLYDTFADPQNPEYHTYTRQQKIEIAALLPLMQDPATKLTFEDAAEIVRNDSIAYWQKLAQAANLGARGSSMLAGGSTLTTDELRRVANALIHHGSAEEELVQEVGDRFSAQEITALLTYADAPEGAAQERIYTRLLEMSQKK